MLGGLCILGIGRSVEPSAELGQDRKAQSEQSESACVCYKSNGLVTAHYAGTRFVRAIPVAFGTSLSFSLVGRCRSGGPPRPSGHSRDQDVKNGRLRTMVVCRSG